MASKYSPSRTKRRLFSLVQHPPAMNVALVKIPHNSSFEKLKYMVVCTRISQKDCVDVVQLFVDNRTKMVFNNFISLANCSDYLTNILYC